MLQVQSIYKQVRTSEGPLQILEDISLELGRGQSLAITGASGSGKSTLLAILAGLDTPTSGRVSLAGTDITALDEEGRARVRAEHVGFVFQSFQLLPGLSALENVLLPLELHGISDAVPKAREMLERVELQHRARHLPRQLSGGEQQRVAIARAFVTRPHILFADEPTGNLDTTTGEHVIDLLFDLNRQSGTTLVLVTHEERLAQHCQQRLVLQGGRVQASTPVMRVPGGSR